MPAPPALVVLQAEARRLGFTQSCDAPTGALLRVLAASKPNGRILELGTGVGESSAWILDGMDADSRLTSVDVEQPQLELAKGVLGSDRRVAFVHQDAALFLETCRESFDLIFADAWPGKFTHRKQALALLRPGGLYVIDDLDPRPDWPHGHESKVERLIAALESEAGLQLVGIAGSTGIVTACRGV